MNLFISYFKKSPAFSIAIFLVIVIEIFLLSTPKLDYLDPTGVFYTTLKRKVAESENNFDYIMLGDSRSLSILGKKSNPAQNTTIDFQNNLNIIDLSQPSFYNFSLPAAGTRYLKYFVDKYLTSNQKPKVIIYALDIEQFRPGQSQAFNVDPTIWSIFKHRLLNLFSLTENLSQYQGKEKYFILKESLPYTIQSVRHREGLDKLLTGMRIKDIKQGDLPYLRSNQRLEKLTDETNGQVNLGTYLEIPPGITNDMIQEIINGSIQAQKDEIPNMITLLDFIHYTNQLQIPLVILEVPHAEGLPESNFYKRVRKEFIQISKNNLNVIYLSFPSKSYSLDYFAEGIHFNAKGEERVNREFNDSIWSQISTIRWKK
jgi:hypothetical protein